ncbi:MAG TPA: hypothetical protein V6C99_04785 [Oculatellaceae cyanobacterium]|jgi:hypothetical protein
MKVFRKIVSGALFGLLLSLPASQASLIRQAQTSEPKLAEVQEQDRLSEALQPIHHYLKQSWIIRLVPPSRESFSTRPRSAPPSYSPPLLRR